VKTEVHVVLEGLGLHILGTYYKGSPEVQTLPNGDPGHPAESESFDFDAVYTKESRTEMRDFLNKYAMPQFWIDLEEAVLLKLAPKSEDAADMWEAKE